MVFYRLKDTHNLIENNLIFDKIERPLLNKTLFDYVYYTYG